MAGLVGLSVVLAADSAHMGAATGQFLKSLRR